MAELKTLQADLEKIKEAIATYRADTTKLVEKRKLVEAAIKAAIKAAKAAAKAAAPKKAAKTSKAAKSDDDSTDEVPQAAEPEDDSTDEVPEVERPPVQGGGAGEPPKTPVKPTTPPSGAPKKKPAKAAKGGAGKGKKLELDE